MLLINQKPDNLGAVASTLCLIHCVATPFIFIAQSGSIACCNTAPTWWKFIDVFFLVISFLAIYRSVQIAVSKWIKPSLWLSWLLLFLIIVNEKTAWFPLHENFIYFPTLALIVLHLYNKRNCQCHTNKRFTNEG